MNNTGWGGHPELTDPVSEDENASMSLLLPEACPSANDNRGWAADPPGITNDPDPIECCEALAAELLTASAMYARRKALK